jgi:hypothetical protein
MKTEYFLFPFGKPTPNDPTKPITDITGAWEAMRKRAGVRCRLHNLRHTAGTKMAEAGVPESTMLALMGAHEQGDDGTLLAYSHGCKTRCRGSDDDWIRRENSEEVPTKVLTVEGADLIQ